MQQTRQNQLTSTDAIRINFMDARFELHQKETEAQKKSKARKRFEARRAIEEHKEEKELQEALKDWWDDIN